MPGGRIGRSEVIKYWRSLLILSESRGKEAAGIALRLNDEIFVYKDARAASEMVNKKDYLSIFDNAFPDGSALTAPLTVIGHSRLVTNGIQTIPRNNQPIIRDGLVGIHNGIIVNDQEIWRDNPDLVKETDVDTEALMALVAKHKRAGLASTALSLSSVIPQIKGTAAVAIIPADEQALVLATNNGSLYHLLDQDQGVFAFASERHIVHQFIRNELGSGDGGYEKIVRVKANEGVLVSTAEFSTSPFVLNSAGDDGDADLLTPAAENSDNLEPDRQTRPVEGRVEAMHKMRVAGNHAFHHIR